MNKEWKYEIGDIVIFKLNSPYEKPTQMLIVGRTIEEYGDGTYFSYVCSYMKLGETVWGKFIENEIIKI